MIARACLDHVSACRIRSNRERTSFTISETCPSHTLSFVQGRPNRAVIRNPSASQPDLRGSDLDTLLCEPWPGSAAFDATSIGTWSGAGRAPGIGVSILSFPATGDECSVCIKRFSSRPLSVLATGCVGGGGSVGTSMARAHWVTPRVGGAEAVGAWISAALESLCLFFISSAPLLENRAQCVPMPVLRQICESRASSVLTEVRIRRNRDITVSRNICRWLYGSQLDTRSPYICLKHNGCCCLNRVWSWIRRGWLWHQRRGARANTTAPGRRHS